MLDILEKTERIFRLRNYSPQTRKAYLLYIKEYITFSREKELKDKQVTIQSS
ncbi:MAG: hypothetical protein UW29_C0015G0003 [Candidatus Collierbacteria bacterium GW2011_GWC2_44_13]|nr:MAG: hypothetical protein UW29_C0015G0003 [Candidatus Collierbacteria bacterium GW2011_GWC2_44_13]